MKKIFLFAILISTALIFSNCKNENKKQKLKELTYLFVSEDQSFQINFPDAPEYFSEEHLDSNLHILNHTYMFSFEDKISYMLSITEYLNLKENLDAKILITSAMNGFNEEVGLELESKNYINFNKYPAVEFVASGSGLKAHLIDFYANSKLYQIGILCNSDYFDIANSEEFLKSFKFTE